MRIRLPRSNRETLESTFLCIVIYCLLLAACGFYFHGTSAAYYGPIVVCAYLILTKSRQLKRGAVKTGTLLCVIVFVSSLIAGDEMRSIFQVWTVIFTGVIVVSVVPKEKFIANYCKIMAILCVASVIIFFAVLLIPGIVRVFPRLYAGTTGAYFMGFSFVRLATRWVSMRNQSIFWEPGCFQTFILLALAFDVSKYGAKNKLRIYSYIVALITTMSTTGFMALLFGILIWLIEENHTKTIKGIRFLVSLCFVLIVATALYSVLPKGIANRTFDKINDILNGSSSNISVNTRINAVAHSFRSFFKSPLFGVGRSGLSAMGNTNEDGMSIMTFTPGNWLGRYGFAFGVIAILGLIQWRDSLFQTQIADILFVLLMILVVSTEAYTTNAVIWIFVFYGLYPGKQISKIQNTQ